MASSLRRVAQKSVRLRDGSRADPELQQIDASWANPAFTSPTASADALQKLSLVFPWLSESEVALEFAGFSHTEITRLLSDKRRSQTTSAQSVFANAANAAGQSSAQDVTASSGSAARSECAQG